MSKTLVKSLTVASLANLQVICVQMVGLLGVDILFQDVDIVWYRNPVDYFHDKSRYI